MNLQLIGNRVLIQPVEEETKMGFIVPEQFREFRTGIVKAVGNGARLKNGQRRPIQLSVGDAVVLSDDFRMPIDIEGKQHFLVSDEKVLCVLVDAKDFMEKHSADYVEENGVLKITRMPTDG